jgi:hypothetical protein
VVATTVSRAFVVAEPGPPDPEQLRDGRPVAGNLGSSMIARRRRSRVVPDRPAKGAGQKIV